MTRRLKQLTEPSPPPRPPTANSSSAVHPPHPLGLRSKFKPTRTNLNPPEIFSFYHCIYSDGQCRRQHTSSSPLTAGQQHDPPRFSRISAARRRRSEYRLRRVQRSEAFQEMVPVVDTLFCSSKHCGVYYYNVCE